MEGVGARLGRSSSRYGAATVFTGPVRKWKKKWIHVTPTAPSSDNKHHSNGNANSNNNNNNNNNNSNSNNNNNNEASHILLYKWTPIRKTHNDNDDDNTNGDENDGEEPPRRKMKYIPIALLEEQNNEAQTDEANPIEDETIAPEADPSSKPDMNDVPMEENQASEITEKQDHNKGLSLNLNACDDDGDEESEDQPN